MKPGLIVLILAVVVLAGCGRGRQPWADGAADPPKPRDNGYLSAPQVQGAERSAGGATQIFGAAAPGSTLRLASPMGGVWTTLADSVGRWSILAAPAATARIFGLSSHVSDRTVQAEGYIAILPAPALPVLLLRAGAGAQRLTPDLGGIGLDLLDIDASGAAVVSGHAPPSTTVAVGLDGTPTGEVSASTDGRFVLSLPHALSRKPHRLTVAGASGVGASRVDIGPPPSVLATPLLARRVTGAWRLDWATPGGGLQTTFMLDQGRP